MKKSTILFVVAALCLFSASAFAQVNAVLGGTVADPTGAVLPGAQVRATNVNTGIVTTLTTNEAGSFQFSSLQPGEYTLSAAFSGFQTTTLTNVLLSQSQVVRQNISMQIAAAAQTVEVTAEADTLLTETSSSVGATLNTRAILALPVVTRNVLDMVALTPGVITVRGGFGGELPNMAGMQAGQVNTTRDGITTNDGRYNDSNGTYSAIFTSPDMVEEVRISTNTIDAALGRGSGQVQMRTRSGSNAYHGALFYTNNNSKFNSLPWFQNLVGATKTYANRNQFGGRFGGPIVQNKAFFFVLLDNQRYVDKNLSTATVLTADARQGIFRYLTSGSPLGTARQNGNALSASPSVSLNGTVRQVNETGTPLFMNSFNLFTDVRDLNRTRIDPVFFTKYLTKMPLPNDYTVGDGLNTAGYRFFQRRDGFDGATGISSNTNRNHITTRFDYQINDNHKLSFTMSREKNWGLSGQTGVRGLPEGFDGTLVRRPDFYTVQYTAVISPTILNEFRFGLKRDPWQGTSPFDAGCCFGGAGERERSASAEAAMALYPKTADGTVINVAPSGGLSTLANFGVSSPRLTFSPLRQIANTVSINKGAHSVQIGFEMNRAFSEGSNTGGQSTTRPSVSLNSNNGGFPIDISTTRFRGLATQDVGPAQTLLGNLAGTVSNITQQFFINSPKDTEWLDYTDTYFFKRKHSQNDWAAYVKDNWKVTRDLTFNMGLRYDKYGTPYDATGLGARFTGGQSGLFGISGTNFANALWAPGVANGSLTTTEFAGKNSPSPDKLLFGNDWNNWAPSFGFAWNVAGLKRATVIRGGYGINYAGAVDFLGYSGNIANIPGLNTNPNFVPSSATGYLDLSSLATRLPLDPGVARPGLPQPVLSAGGRSQNVTGYADDRQIPYIQSFNFSITRELARNITLEVGWVGNKATKLWGNWQLNESNIFENGLLEAFNVTRAGGNAPLFDKMLMGLTVPGSTGAVNGTTVTGSGALRRWNNVTNQFLANGNVGGLANFLNTSTAITGLAGGLLANGGLPANFISVNPQFSSVNLNTNIGNSTYHSMQAVVTQRYTRGFSGQFSYVFSKNLGLTGERDPRNRQLSKGILGNNRAHVLKINGAWDLPTFRASGLLDRIVGGWTLSPNLQWVSGSPLSFTSGNGTVGSRVNNTANLVGSLNPGSVVKGNTVQYFSGMSIQNATAPVFGSDSAALTGRFTNRNIVDASGNIVLTNPEPGRTGNLAQNLGRITGPAALGFDLSLSKKIVVRESMSFTVRGDAIDILNRPVWGNPTTDINSANFGRINNADGNRTITLSARFDF